MSSSSERESMMLLSKDGCVSSRKAGAGTVEQLQTTTTTWTQVVPTLSEGLTHLNCDHSLDLQK